MRSNLLVLYNILVFVCVASANLLNPYPEFKFFSDNDDAGEPLYLTKYIENGEIEAGQNASLVTHPDIKIRSYAGYLTVTKKYDSKLFFWYFPAAKNPENAPVLLWLQGGPGASSLFVLLTENGPFRVTLKQNLVPNDYSWHINHNLIYIDNPVGAGFSFTASDDGYANNETIVARDLLSALQQFFVLFPKLQRNDFFVSGESYAGKYVPAIGYAIYQDNKRWRNDPQKPKINLKGLAIGNGFTDPINQLNYADYLFQLGLIDTNGPKLMADKRDEGIDCIKNGDYRCALNVMDYILSTSFRKLAGYFNYYNYLKTEDDSDMNGMSEFLQKSITRRAIHVGKKPFGATESVVYNHLALDQMVSVADWVSELLSHYPIMFYNGQLDVICAYPMTDNFLKHLKFSGDEEFKHAKRDIWRVGKEVAGYVKRAGNLTQVLVRNAGHMVPTDQSEWALDMILRFTQN